MVEAKLCITTGGSIGRQLIAKAIATLRKVVGQRQVNEGQIRAALVVLVPDDVKIDE